MFALDLPFCPVEFLQLLCSSYKERKQKPNTTPDQHKTTATKLLKRRGFCKACRIELGCNILSALDDSAAKRREQAAPETVLNSTAGLHKYGNIPQRNALRLWFSETCLPQNKSVTRVRMWKKRKTACKKSFSARAENKFILQCFFSPVALTSVWVCVRGILVLDP